MSALYVFALTGGPARPLRHGNRRIEFIEIKGIHAAVERITRPPAVSEAALRAQHEIVMEIARAVDAIVPARFGAVVERQELEALVSSRRGPLREALDLVAGRVQMTVRGFEEAAGVASAAGLPANRTSGTAYLEQRRRDAAAPLEQEAAEISRVVRPFVHQERTQAGQSRIRWTLYHLVDRGVVADYERAVTPFTSQSVSVSGPWPPFAFVPDLWP